MTRYFQHLLTEQQQQKKKKESMSPSVLLRRSNIVGIEWTMYCKVGQSERETKTTLNMVSDGR